MKSITPLKTARYSRWWCFVLLTNLYFFSALAQSETEAENFLSDDELLQEDEFEFHEDSADSVWHKSIRITLQQTYLQGEHLEISRSEARIEYEVAPWEGAYFRLDNKYTYFAHNDQQVLNDEEAFGHNKLQEAWLQLSESSCVAKLGRQGLTWGEVEGAFAVDVVSPFDFTEPLLTDYSNIRLSQDMFLADCYFSNTQVQSFFVSAARLNVFQQQNTTLIDQLEDDLHEEWGFRVSQRWRGVDVSLMYAHLYGNEPLSIIDFDQLNGVRLEVARYDFIGLSTAWAIGRLLLELDVAFKKNQLENYSGKENDNFELAFGFEYTTSGNHHFNAGVWFFDEVFQASLFDTRPKVEVVQSWNLGWSKTYLNDDLAVSFLGAWMTEFDLLTTTLLAQYQWDDYWSYSSALTYADASKEPAISSFDRSDLAVLFKVKFEF